MDAPDSLLITQLLVRVNEGDRAALDEFTATIYEEIRKLAATHMRRERVGHTLETTALANEALLRLLGNQDVGWEDRKRFFAHASRVMRNVLIDHAKAKLTVKRGGDRERVDFTVLLDQYDSRPLDAATLVDLNDALEHLARIEKRAANVLEHRLFMNLTIKETAAVLGVSATTVEQDTKVGLAFLRTKLREPDAG